MKELAYLNKFFYKYRWKFLLGIFFVAISNYFRILQPQAIRHALDLVLENVNLYRLYDGFPQQSQLLKSLGSSLMYFGVLTLIFALLMGIFMYYMRQTIIVMSRWIEYDLRNEIFKQYECLNMAFYKKNNTGDLMARITEDVSKVRMYLGPAIMYGINLVVLCVMVIYAMIEVNPMLTLYSLVPLPILSYSIYRVNRVINDKSTAIQGQLSVLNSLSQEVYSGVRVVKSYAQEEAMGRYFGEACETYKEKNLDLAKVDAFFRPLMLLLIGASTIITVYVGGMLVMQGQLSVGNIAEFIIYINMLTWPVTSIGWVASIIQQAAASQKRINEFLSIQPAIRHDNKPKTAKIQGALRFDRVSFTYPDTGIEALKDISFSLNKGQKLCILGKTGAGKTTIADLLLRLYEPTTGEIYLDGKPLREHNLAQLRESVGYVPQDVFLFSDTIYNNIAFALPELDRGQAERYARYASIEQEILDLPKGFDTVIGERGVTLSGGQKQRISIARALIKEPEILLFDDCLSALDTHTEAQIAGYLQELCADKTTIVITHRLYAALQFDWILVMADGQIVEQGTHEDLLALKGQYYEVYEQQRQQFAER
jgi:ATP-binding cassette subfamily B protein